MREQVDCRTSGRRNPSSASKESTAAAPRPLAAEGHRSSPIEGESIHSSGAWWVDHSRVMNSSGRRRPLAPPSTRPPRPATGKGRDDVSAPRKRGRRGGVGCVEGPVLLVDLAEDTRFLDGRARARQRRKAWAIRESRPPGPRGRPIAQGAGPRPPASRSFGGAPAPCSGVFDRSPRTRGTRVCATSKAASIG